MNAGRTPPPQANFYVISQEEKDESNVQRRDERKISPGLTLDSRRKKKKKKKKKKKIYLQLYVVNSSESTRIRSHDLLISSLRKPTS
jgi:hypothetical protein